MAHIFIYTNTRIFLSIKFISDIILNERIKNSKSHNKYIVKRSIIYFFKLV